MPEASHRVVPFGNGLDPITAETIIHRLCAIPNLIDKNIAQTAYSFLISEYKDYAVGILDARGRLIAQCKGGLPIFCANALSAAIRDGLNIYGIAGLRNGDVIISNNAATMGQHLNNVVMYTPIRVSADPSGLIGFFAIVMHWVDVGGITIGSCGSPFTTDVFQEGIQFPTMRLLKEGERVDDVYRLIETNTRLPKMVMGDLESQVSGCLMGREMTLDIVANYGVNNVLSAVDLYLQRSEKTVRDAIARIPDGEYRASSFLDDDGIARDRPIEINVTVRVEGDEITIDLSEIADQVAGPLNAGFEGGAVAAARIASKYVFSPHEPANDGAFRPIKVVCPPGKFLSARPDAPIGGSGSTIPTVVDTILAAFAHAVPDRIPAAHHGTYGIHVIDGRDPSTGEWFQHLESTIGGWGASSKRDGTGPFRSNAHGDTKEIPVELQEASHPYRVDWVRLRADSGGAGKFRGSPGIEKAYRILVPCRLTVSMERTKCPPWGLNGGLSGKPGRIEVHREDGEVIVLRKDEIRLYPGDQVRVMTAGGGGYGDPKTRPKEWVKRDILDGYVTPVAADL